MKINLDDLRGGSDRPKKKGFKHTVSCATELEQIIKDCRSEHGKYETAEMIRRLILVGLPEAQRELRSKKQNKKVQLMEESCQT